MNPEPAKDEASVLQKVPSSMRLDRVQTILETEPALKDRLGPKDQEVVKRNGEKVRFSRGVIAVAVYLHEHGYDPHNAPRPVVLDCATEVLHLFKAAPSKKKAAPAENKAEANETKSAPVEKARPAKVEVKEPEPKPEPKPEPAVIQPRPRKPKATAPPKETLPAPAQASNPVTVPALTQLPAPLVPDMATVEVMPTIAPFVSVLSLFLGAYNLLKNFDREPGAEKRLDRLNEQIDEMNKLRDVMVPIPINTLPPCLAQNDCKPAS